MQHYFQTIFFDIAMRRRTNKKTKDEQEFIDRVAFFEFTKLPGIINDRFYFLFPKEDHRIYQKGFIDSLTTVYLSKLDEKLKFTFKM